MSTQVQPLKVGDVVRVVRPNPGTEAWLVAGTGSLPLGTLFIVAGVYPDGDICLEGTNGFISSEYFEKVTDDNEGTPETNSMLKKVPERYELNEDECSVTLSTGNYICCLNTVATGFVLYGGNLDTVIAHNVTAEDCETLSTYFKNLGDALKVIQNPS